MNPPPIPRSGPPKRKSWRWAATLNLFLPGAGLYYMGRRKLGGTIALLFLACLAAALGIFLVGYIQYFNVTLGGDLMQEGQLEKLDNVFHGGWLLGFLAVGIVLYLVSMVALSGARQDVLKKSEEKLLG